MRAECGTMELWGQLGIGFERKEKDISGVWVQSSDKRWVYIIL